MAAYAWILTFGPDAEKRLALRPTHRERLAQLLADGKLHESGPWVDDTGALIVFHAESIDEAQALADGDPYQDGGEGVIASSILKEWKIVYADHPEN